MECFLIVSRCEIGSKPLQTDNLKADLINELNDFRLALLNGLDTEPGLETDLGNLKTNLDLLQSTDPATYDQLMKFDLVSPSPNPLFLNFGKFIHLKMGNESLVDVMNNPSLTQDFSLVYLIILIRGIENSSANTCR